MIATNPPNCSYDLLCGPGPLSLPCPLGVELLRGLFCLSRNFPLSLALHLASLPIPTRARFKMSLRLALYTQGVLVLAALLLQQLLLLCDIPLLEVEGPLVLRVDLKIDPFAVGT